MMVRWKNILQRFIAPLIIITMSINGGGGFVYAVGNPIKLSDLPRRANIYDVNTTWGGSVVHWAKVLDDDDGYTKLVTQDIIGRMVYGQSTSYGHSNIKDFLNSETQFSGTTSKDLKDKAKTNQYGEYIL